MNLPARVRAGREQKSSSSKSFYVGCHQEVPSHLKRSNQENPTWACPAAGVLTDSRCCQVDDQDWPSQWDSETRHDLVVVEVHS